MADNRGRHDSNRSGAGDQHIFAKNWKRKSCMNSVPERVKNCGDLQRHFRIVLPDIAHRQDDVLGKCSGAVDSYALRMRTEMTSACQAIAAASAYDVSFTADQFAGMKVVDIGSDLNDLADEFMPDHQRNRDRAARPIVPVINMEVRAADSGQQDTHFYVIDSGLRFGYVLQP